MIILIGETSCTGKTYIAHRVMQKYHIPYFSLDILMMGLFKSTDKSSFDPMDEKEEISEVVWPIAEKMIETNIENCTSYIYEGFQILPGSIREIPNNFRKEIFPVFIVFSEEYIRKNYEIIKSKRGVIESRYDMDDKELMIIRNKDYLEECNDEKQEVFVIRNNYEAESDMIINCIGNRINS